MYPLEACLGKKEKTEMWFDLVAAESNQLTEGSELLVD